MHDVICIGDDITTIGFRLAGVPTFVPTKADLIDVIANERSSCRVMILTSALFNALPEKFADDLKHARSPLLAIVPDVQGTAPVPDMELQVKQALRIEV